MVLGPGGNKVGEKRRDACKDGMQDLADAVGVLTSGWLGQGAKER